MPYYCATVKVLVEDQDIEHAQSTIREGMNWLRNDENVILDWGYSLDVPKDKGPRPREIDPRLGEVYERNLTGIEDTKDVALKESLEAENEELFKRL